MLVEVTKKETVELGLPHYSKNSNVYTFISTNETVLEVAHFMDGTVSISTQLPGSYYQKAAIERAVEAQPIDSEEFEVKFCEALTKVGQQLGLDPINLKAV